MFVNAPRVLTQSALLLTLCDCAAVAFINACQNTVQFDFPARGKFFFDIGIEKSVDLITLLDRSFLFV